MSTKSIIRRIAREHGVTPEQVEADIKEAIRFSMMSKAAGSQAFWRELSPDGREPSVDVFLKFCAKKLKIR